MTIGTLRIAGRKFRIIPEDEYKALRTALRSQQRRQSNPRKPKTLKQMNAWMSTHWDEVLAKAKNNTKRLTGREVL